MDYAPVAALKYALSDGNVNGHYVGLGLYIQSNQIHGTNTIVDYAFLILCVWLH